ncbi:MAG: adenine phosphoribosyltransferase [Desulfobacterales bacterium CG23_combo_of_CG06-09_8_20_14_all_52_9]|nr:MAG: adenine phosphoribosyltransferase [Desulfobacterales bacterium CG23_combo_of_CG06-09_8_20_14_all_52_9]
MDLKEAIRTVPHWPIEGVMFRDITTLLQDPGAFRKACDLFYERYRDMDLDKVVGIDARGFIFGSVLAYKLNTGFVPIRKKGKLPYKTVSESYTLEYGTSVVEIHEDAIRKGERVLIMDDLIATGGTISAATRLVERLGGIIVECAFLVGLPDLKGRELIQNYKIFTLTEFEGE